MPPRGWAREGLPSTASARRYTRSARPSPATRSMTRARPPAGRSAIAPPATPARPRGGASRLPPIRLTSTTAAAPSRRRIGAPPQAPASRSSRPWPPSTSRPRRRGRGHDLRSAPRRARVRSRPVDRVVEEQRQLPRRSGSEAATFEDASAAVLDAMLSVAEEALAASSYAQRARILRGMVHVRPSAGPPPASCRRARRGAARTGGASLVLGHGVAMGRRAPRAHRHRRRPTASIPVDVEASSRPGASSLDRHAPVLRSRPRLASSRAKRPTSSSCPCGRAGRRCRGHALHRGHCRTAAQANPFPSCVDGLQTLAAVAALYLRMLPLRPVAAAAPDEYLPVVGASMGDVLSSHLQSSRLRGRDRPPPRPHGAPVSRGPTREVVPRAVGPARRTRSRTLVLSTAPEGLQMAEALRLEEGAPSTGAVANNPGRYRPRQGRDAVHRRDRQSSRLNSQAGLLRVLEERKYRPLGDGAAEQRGRTSASSSAPTCRPSRVPCAMGASAWTSTTASTCCPCSCRRSPTGATRSPLGRRTCSSGSAGGVHRAAMRTSLC